MLQLKNNNQTKTINEKISYLKNKKHLNEDCDARIKRKAREYVKACNMKNEKQVFNGVGNVNAVKYYGKRTPREYEKDEIATSKITIKTPVILLDENEITVEEGVVEKMKIREKHLEETDKEYEKIVVILPKYKIKIVCENIDFDDIPQKIKYEKEEIEKEEIFSAMIGKNAKLYKAKEIL